MKKALISLICFSVALVINAYTFSYNGIYYDIVSVSDLTVKVVKQSFSQSGYYGEVIIPETVPYSNQTFTVTEIDFGVFVDATSVTKISIPKTVTKIGEQITNNCKSLKEFDVSPQNPNYCDIDGVLFNKGKTQILFYPNAKSTDYTLPESTISIGKNAFTLCMGLKKLNMNNGLKYIYGSSFYYTSGLTELRFPKTMVSIDDAAFSRSNNIRNIWVENETPFTIHENTFTSDVYLNATLYVPVGSKDKYKSKTGWKNFINIIEDEIEPTPNPKCATPSINYQNGQIVFNCDTEGVKYISEITCKDYDSYDTQIVPLTMLYTITVYATKDGYDNSDTASMQINVRGLKGDVNDDGEVNIADINSTIDIILRQ